MNFGDYVRDFYLKVTEFVIEHFGKKLYLYPLIIDKEICNLYSEQKELKYEEKCIELRGFYKINPSKIYSSFGLDSPTTMQISVPLSSGNYPIGSLIHDFKGGKWMIENREIKDHILFGLNRLILNVVVYHETVTSEGKI